MVERFDIGRGLALPIEGEPEQAIDSKEVSEVALVADDYIGMRPTMLVSEGDRVQLGQPVFADKKTPGVTFVAPASGTIKSINRGEKRRFLSIIVSKEGDQESLDFGAVGTEGIGSLNREVVVEKLLQSGLWTSLRRRPFSRVPSPEDPAPAAVFINAMDTNPLAANPAVVVAEHTEAFKVGVQAVSHLADKTFVCRAANSSVPGEMLPGVQVAEFSGPHPSGLVGTHMHFLRPATLGKVNWHLNYQDAIAIGELFLSGKISTQRVISLAGPAVKKPRLIRTEIGASIAQLTEGELVGDDLRVISGSVLNGRKNCELTNYLGRYHLQVSGLAEGHERELLGWQMPGFDKFSVTKAFASAWTGVSKFALTTSTGGSDRAMVPIGVYEKVMPLDLIPTPLLRSLISRDTGTAQELGCLELDEEDLALCTFVCPGKYEYGEILRDNLLTIEKEG